MPLASLPIEVIDKVALYLDKPSLSSLRLITHFYSTVLRRHLFAEITLSSSSQSLQSWAHITANDDLRCLPRNVEIITPRLVTDCTYSRDVPASAESSDHIAWGETLTTTNGIEYWIPPDSSAMFTSFYACLNELALLPSLDHVQLSINKHDTSPNSEADDSAWTVRKSLYYRTVMRMAMDAVHRRKQSPDLRGVRKLTITGIRDWDTVLEKSADWYAEALRGTESLDMLVTVVYGAHYPMRKEPNLFFGHVRDFWIRPIATELKHLTLGFISGSKGGLMAWGRLPGFFDPGDVCLPRLESLRVKKLWIGHDKALDWILAQRSLKRLYLYDPCIISYYRVPRDGLDGDWEMPCSRWQELDAEAWDVGSNVALCHYGGRWSMFFDRIRAKLTNLEYFEYISQTRLGRSYTSAAGIFKDGYGCWSQIDAYNLADANWTWMEDFEKVSGSRAPAGVKMCVGEEVGQEDEAAYWRLSDVCRNRRRTRVEAS